MVLLAIVGGIVGFLDLFLMAALARPAEAASLPNPSGTTSSLPLGSGVGGIENTVGGAVGSVPTVPTPGLPAVPGAPLPSPVPVPTVPVPSAPLPSLPSLPLPSLPIVISPVTGPGTPGVTPSGGPGGPGPGTGGPAHGSKGRSPGATGQAAPQIRQAITTGSTVGGAVEAKAGQGSGNGRPEQPTPRFPFFPSLSGEGFGSAVHGSSPWNILPLVLGIVGALAVVAVVLRRRLTPKALFSSRFSPPG